MKVILLHGKDASPSDKWYPWLRKEVERLGVEFHAPTLPNPSDPRIEEWKSALSQLRPDEDTILIGHSRGGVAILRWLEDQKPSVKVRKVILVATNSGLLSKRAIKGESNFGFYTDEGYDFGRIKKHSDSFVILHSKDDEWVPYDAGLENASGLDAKFRSFENKGHFGSKVKEVPEIMAEVQGDS
ncbi:MAG: alpha/beta hydrolase [bacterium]|nr:alpha/beta hydrolase [bacterium]MDZ4248098.1 alpha/beta hydrolase [Patescibacteria group bacterium]